MNRRLSLSECDSPVTTPTGMMPQVPMHKFVPDTDTSALKELADPPTEGHSPAGIQWTQSLETPTKTHGRRGDTMTPRSNMILRLRGLQPHVSGKQASPGEFAGWSPSMETPPRKATCKADAEHQKISENMLDKLRGIPHDAPLFDDDRQSTVSQEERFYSAPSSIADAEREYQLGVAPASDGDYLVDKGSARFKATAVIIAVRSGSCSSIDVDSTSTDDASSDIASLPDAINLTLSSSIVQELEQDLYRNCSPVMNSQRRFEGSSTPDHASRQVVIENRDSVQLSRTMAISEVMAVERGPLLISNQRGAAIGTSISQDLDNMQLEPWSSPLADTQPKDAQEYHHGSAHRQRSPKLMEEKVVDDFEDIRFSQLDDGFGLPDMTQRPQNVIIDTEMKHNHLSSDDASWHATSAFMFQADSEPDPEDIPSQSVSRATSISVPGGFICASGRKLAVPSKEALTRVTGLLESHAEGISTAGQPEADLSFAVFAGFRSAGGRQLAPVSTAAFAMASGLFGDEASFQEDPVVLEASKISTSSLSFGGFQSAGGKVLAPISKAAEDRAARLLTEDSLIIEAPVPGINDTDAHGHGYAISTNGAIDGQQAVPEQTGGFASASGKKLAPTSKAVMDSWSRRFADDSVADMSRGMSHSAMPILARERFSGFALGAGKQLAVISKAAKTHALSGLNVDGPGLSTPTLQITGTKPVSLENGSSGATGTLDMPKPPAISTHMQKLKLKALRTPSANALMPTGRKSLLKSLEPLRSPRQFKPPLKTNADITAITAATTAATGRAIETAASTTTASSAGIMGDTSLKNSTTSLEVDNADLDDDTCTTVNEVRVPSNNGQRAKLSALGSPQRYEARDLLELGVPEDVVYMTLAKAKTYQFDDWGINEAYENLLVRGAHRELLSKSWLANHYAMIVWKLACYVRSWPQKLIAAAEAGSGWFCPDKLLDQLAYRYEREINRAERPALRKVVEGDESPARHMVLAFAEIKSEYSEDAKQDILKASVTDGWYIIPVSLDACLTKAAERGILRIGSKIHVCQAKLTGAESGVAIQEVINGLSSVSMVLQANLTRLARWDKKLGFQREPMVWTTRLRNIMPQGGLVPALDVIVLRRYPVMYLETLEDGTKIRRTAREEDRAAEAHRDAMQKRYQEMVTQVHVMLGVVDGDGPLSSSQPVKVQQEVQARATDLEVQVTARNVMPFFSIRVGDYHHGGRSMEDDNESGHHQEAIITLWHDDVTPFQEGHRIRITSLMAKKSNREYADVKVQLTATRMTTVRRMPTDPEAMLLTAYQPREITTCADIGSLYYGAEVDLVVAVLERILLTIHLISTMNKHLQQPASMGTPPTPHHPEQLSTPTKKQPTHGPTTQSIFKTSPNLQTQQSSDSSAEAKKHHHGFMKKSSGSHPQKVDHNTL
ncbi:Breast cancer 2, early onset [Mortierella sp. GBA30]|nr:Breast cancer 2, early onset [Mortierella sp. GBA30]